MIFAETDTNLNALYVGMLALVVVLTQLAREWRDTMRARNKIAFDERSKKEMDVQAVVNKAALDEVARKAEAVKTTLVGTASATNIKLAEVESTLANKTALIQQSIDKLDHVAAAMVENTAITDEVKQIAVDTHKLVNGQRDKMIAHIDALQKLMAEHGIDCPPHPLRELK